MDFRKGKQKGNSKSSNVLEHLRTIAPFAKAHEEQFTLERVNNCYVVFSILNFF
jgi:hypothetical protein